MGTAASKNPFSHRWLKATKYIHSSTVVYLRGTCTLLGYVHFLPPYTSEAYILLFTTLFTSHRAFLHNGIATLAQAQDLSTSFISVGQAA